MRERRRVWVERRSVERETEELELVGVEGLGAGLRTKRLEAREE